MSILKLPNTLNVPFATKLSKREGKRRKLAWEIVKAFLCMFKMKTHPPSLPLSFSFSSFIPLFFSVSLLLSLPYFTLTPSLPLFLSLTLSLSLFLAQSPSLFLPLSLCPFLVLPLSVPLFLSLRRSFEKWGGTATPRDGLKFHVWKSKQNLFKKTFLFSLSLQNNLTSTNLFLMHYFVTRT